MAWLWFILFIIVLIGNIRTFYRLQRAGKNQDAMVSSLVAIIIEEKVKPEQAALRYLENLDNSLLYQNYDEFMQGLCSQHGLVYRKDRTGDGGVLADDVRTELARRLALVFNEVASRVIESKNDADE